MAPGKDGGESLNGNMLQIVSCLSDCKSLCDQHPECNGFLFDSDKDICQLRKLNTTDTLNLKQSNGILYYNSNFEKNRMPKIESELKLTEIAENKNSSEISNDQVRSRKSIQSSDTEINQDSFNQGGILNNILYNVSSSYKPLSEMSCDPISIIPETGNGLYSYYKGDCDIFRFQCPVNSRAILKIHKMDSIWAKKRHLIIHSEIDTSGIKFIKSRTSYIRDNSDRKRLEFTK